MKNRKVAVIGGGCAGATAAWAMRKTHDVVLFEAEAALGGHAFTAEVHTEGGTAHVDMGVEYFNERLSPNLCALLEHFGIGTYIAPLSMKVNFAGPNSFWSNLNNDGRLRKQLSAEFDRFHLDMSNILNSGEQRYKHMSIGEFLAERKYSDAFRYQGLLPLLTTFSGCNAPSLSYNLMYAALSFNMNLLSFFAPGYWRKADNGIDGYLKKVCLDLGESVRLKNPVRSVKKVGKKLLVTSISGAQENFDDVVFATHADIALALLDEPGAGRAELLGQFDYVPVTSVLHSDSSILTSPVSREYCEFTMPDSFELGSNKKEYGTLTRINNNLLRYSDLEKPLLVTFDPKVAIADDLVLERKRWKLPKLRPADFFRKTQMRTIQGQDNIWFCGTDTSLTGHEGALTSGLVIASRLGAPYPFQRNMLSKIQFNVVKDIMGVRKPNEIASSLLSEAIFKIGKAFSLHKEQSHKFIRDLMV